VNKQSVYTIQVGLMLENVITYTCGMKEVKDAHNHKPVNRLTDWIVLT